MNQTSAKPVSFRHAARRRAIHAALSVAVCGVLVLSLGLHAAPAQEPTLHYRHEIDMPPGSIGRWRLQRGGPVIGYFQPVRIQGPQGVLVSAAVEGQFQAPRPAPLTLGLLIGCAYRLKVTDIPLHEGTEVYPTIEVIDRLYPPCGQETRFPIPIELTQEELELAAGGGYVTRVIYLEAPETALPRADDPERQRYFEASAGQDPLKAADQLGRPVAILRMGSRLPDATGGGNRFTYGAPPLMQYAAPAASHAAALTGAIEDTPPCPSPSAPCPSPPTPTTLPWQALAGPPPCAGPSGCQEAACRWAPPGLRCPWPADEYLCDGGDRKAAVQVARDWRVDGLDLEDTVVHYDTLAGETEVQPSNRVCVYAPRFAAVRKVYGLAQNQQQLRLAGVELPARPERQDDVSGPESVMQPLQIERRLGMKPAYAYRARAGGDGLDNAQKLAGTERLALPYEDSLVTVGEIFRSAQEPQRTETREAAVVWTHDKAVQILIAGQEAVVAVNDQRPQAVYVYDMPPGKPCLCVVKTASRREAQPGDVVDFTLRLRNVGNEPVGNVTVIDNLTTRLEYVAESAQCSRQADFFTDANEGGSLVLRWEIIDPMEVGEEAEIHFQCRVR